MDLSWQSTPLERGMPGRLSQREYAEKDRKSTKPQGMWPEAECAIIWIDNRLQSIILFSFILGAVRLLVWHMVKGFALRIGREGWVCHRQTYANGD